MEFRLLGPFEVVDGGEQLDLGSRKQRAVLALLAIHANTVLSLDRLIDELWGREPPPRALGTLQAYVSNLRRVLERNRPAGEPPRWLVTQSPGYVLRIEPDVLDVARFEAAAAQGRRLLAERRPDAARSRLEEGLALWRGPALADFEFEEFARAEAARLEELRLVAVEDRLQAELDLGSHVSVVAELEKMVCAHPLRESLWGLLMLALYRSERQADALRAYQNARRHLGEELGLEPGPALRRLEADILAQSPALDWTPPTPSDPSATFAGSAPRPVAAAAERRAEPAGSSGQPIRVVVCDDHPLFREGLLTVLADLPGVEAVAEAGDGEAAVAAVASFRPQVVMMDLRMPGMNGVDATQQITRSYPDVAVLVLTMSEDDESVFAALRAGARGYLLKEAGKDDIARALHALVRGEAVFGAKVAPRMLALFATGSSPPAVPFPQLTDREREILELVAAGYGNPTIARRLFLSEKTVRNNVSVIMAKLGVATRAEAVAAARDAGLGQRSSG